MGQHIDRREAQMYPNRPSQLGDQAGESSSFHPLCGALSSTPVRQPLSPTVPGELAFAEQTLSPTVSGDRRWRGGGTVPNASAAPQGENEPMRLQQLPHALRDEACEWACEHVLQAPFTEDPGQPLLQCGLCGVDISGVVCHTPSWGVLHFGCAVAERESMLRARDARYMKRCRRERHNEFWQAARARKRPQQRPCQPTASRVESDAVHAPPRAMARGSSCWGGLCMQIVSLSSLAARSCLDRFASWRRMLASGGAARRREAAEKAAAQAERELLGWDACNAAHGSAGFLSTVANKCLSFFQGCMAPTRHEEPVVTMPRCGKRLLQQGSRGAHLARMSAAKRGVRLQRWSRVRRHRAAHQWAHTGAFASGLSFACTVAARACESVCSGWRFLCNSVRSVWKREPCSRHGSAGGSPPAVTQMQGRLHAYSFARRVSSYTCARVCMYMCAFLSRCTTYGICVHACVNAQSCLHLRIYPQPLKDTRTHIPQMVRIGAHAHTYTYTHTYIYIYIYIYMLMSMPACVCVCICVRFYLDLPPMGYVFVRVSVSGAIYTCVYIPSR